MDERPQEGEIWQYNGARGREHYLFLKMIHPSGGSGDEKWSALSLDYNDFRSIYWWPSAYKKVA